MGYLRWKTSKDLLYSTWKPVQCCVAAWMGGEFGGEWIHMCMAETLCCSPETITTLFVNWLYPNTKKKVKNNQDKQKNQEQQWAQQTSQS